MNVLVSELSKFESLTVADSTYSLAVANSALADLGSKIIGETDYWEKDFIEVSLVMLTSSESGWYLFSLGDCPAYQISANKRTRINSSQTDHAFDLLNSMIVTNLSREEAAVAIRRQNRNKPGIKPEYSIFTGENACVSLLQIHKLTVRSGDRILLTSDGIPPDMEEPLYSGSALNLVNQSEEFVRHRLSLQNEPLGSRPLYQDDKSVISINFL